MNLAQLKSLLVKIIGTDNYYLKRVSGDLAGATLTVGAGTVGQTELKTTTGYVETGSLTYVNVTIPGGEYAFFRQVKVNSASWPGDVQGPKNFNNTSYATLESYQNASGAAGGRTRIQVRYVQA